MPDFKHLMTSGFSGCPVVALARDLNRGRDVRLHHIPGRFDVIGIADGTDSWIAPVAVTCFDVPIASIIADIRLTGRVPSSPHRAKTLPAQAALPFGKERRRAVRVPGDPLAGPGGRPEAGNDPRPAKERRRVRA